MKSQPSKIKKVNKEKITEHYHCPHCGRVLKEIYRLDWKVEYGIRIIYSCGEDMFCWVERQNITYELKI